MPAGRRRALQSLCAARAAGDVVLDAGTPPADPERALLTEPGVGPWTASYIPMRALGAPDAFPASDLGLRRGAAALGMPDSAPALARHAERWRPWRSYAALHLWGACRATLTNEATTTTGRSA